MKIQVKLRDKEFPIQVIDKGDWIDLYVTEDVTIEKEKSESYPKLAILPLNVAMKLPEGYEAIVVPRSSTYKHFGITCANSFGVIDNSYCGNEDFWGFPALSYRKTTIKRGSRVCQFRIQLSQKATIWQRIKWLFDSKIEFEYTDNLSSESRGGFGTTGKN
jgi:dUTP pyrophosphatase